MILTERTINIIDHESIMDSPVVLYRGDKNVELKLNIKSSRFKFRDDDSSNFIESAQASYGQLIIQTPNQNEPIFSEIAATKKGCIIFVITAEMIDEIDEVGKYTFQVRLLDSNKRSRATIPPVVNGIEIREPITSEDSNALNSAVVGLASAANEEALDTFDMNGDYAKTNWKFGDKITAAKLNKAEDGIYQSYALGLYNASQIKDKANDNEVRKISHPITLADLSTDVKEALTGGSVAVVGKDTVGNENIKYKAISRNKLNFTENCSNNLFDLNDVDRDGYINGNGVFVPSDTYFDSGFISVEPNTNYCSNINGFHVAFDVDKHVIGLITRNDYLFTTPSNCYFIKVACNKAELDTYMINKGDVLLPYEKCVYKDKSLLIEVNDVKGIDEIQLTEDNCTFLIKKVGTNLFDKSKVISNKYYNATNGALTTYNGYNASDFIEVEEGVNYSWNSPGHFCYWDENKQYVNGFNGNVTSKTIPTNMGIKYITFSIATNALDTTMFVKGNLPPTYIPYKKYYQLNDSIVIQNTAHKLSGLKWNVLGDSITSTNYANKRYWEYISDETGIQVNNYGISGSRVAVWPGHDQPMCIRYANMTDDADIITVFAGTNDFSNSVTLGDITSTDTGTFYGALNVLCKGLIEKYPGKRIGFITPIQRYGVPFDDSKWQSYQNAIKEVCGKYSIPVLDGTKEVGLAISSVPSIKDKYTIDGLHLNDEGHKIFARRVLSFIESL